MRDASSSSETLRRFAETPVRLAEFGPAGELLDDVVSSDSFLHAGPPVEAKDSIGPMRGALIGALLLEGVAETAEEAESLVSDGFVRLTPCHDVGGVGPLAGVVSPSVPVVVVGDGTGTRAFAPLVEGLGKALSFGNYDSQTIQKLRWLASDFSSILNQAVSAVDPIDIVEVQARSLRRGDEGHNRLVAATERLIVDLAPAFVKIGRRAEPVLDELRANPHFFLALSAAAAKCLSMRIESEGPAGIVTALAGNGIVSGIRVSGSHKPWHIGPPITPSNMMLIPGRSEDDAAPLMGDSGVTETVGLGAFSLTASLSLARVLGVDAAGAQRIVDDMREISVTEHPRFLLPADDFRGAPLGISLAAICETGTTPVVNAGYAHKEPGAGRVGANVASFPLEIFEEAQASLKGGR